MRTFPLTQELPAFLDTTGWHWSQIDAFGPSNGFWIGTDSQGNRWLTKLQGSYAAYREVVFSRLLQAMGWSCQSSVFLHLDSYSTAKLNPETSGIQAAHWFIDEHPAETCSQSCPFGHLNTISRRRVEDLDELNVDHILDWPKAELACCLFGGLEPPGRLFSVAHECVIIDGELSFTVGQPPTDFSSTEWLGSQRGVELALEVCRDFLRLSPSQIQDAVALPYGVTVEDPIGLLSMLVASRLFARKYFRDLEVLEAAERSQLEIKIS